MVLDFDAYLQESPIEAPSTYGRVLQNLKKALGPKRKPLLIAIDGNDGVGKTSLASWLSWQLNMPTVHLDLYLIRGNAPLKWRVEEINCLVSKRIDDEERPIIVEGITALDALHEIARAPNYLIYIEGASQSLCFATLLEDYRSRRKPQDKARYIFEGFSES